MQWWKNQTDRDWDAQHLANESLRHERLARESSMVDWIETTPENEPLPKMTMARLRQQKLDEETEKVRNIWQNYDDEIQL